jgi:hypothetical protein
MVPLRIALCMLLKIGKTSPPPRVQNDSMMMNILGSFTFPVMNNSDSRDSSVRNTPGSRDSPPVMNTPGSRDSPPVMNTPGSQDSLLSRDS